MGLQRRRPTGLSPRVRGNPSETVSRQTRARSIPACAGEPRHWLYQLRLSAVYPRVCGGTESYLRPSPIKLGLSPRVRGNHIAGCIAQQGRRSIPACAGEPADGFHRSDWRAVYPRVCGGTGYRRHAHKPLQGLSPRVRGNPPTAVNAGPENRSIPACAGEPESRLTHVIPLSVYPRVCGGTCKSYPFLIPLVGLSPRVRGNHCGSWGEHVNLRSIPACAGEPGLLYVKDNWDRVYPRVCGGTMTTTARRTHIHHLSPRVRGNHRQRDDHWDERRSIPACAGEPTNAKTSLSSDGVYPRVCGGTRAGQRRHRRRSGLSPRVRGNRSRRMHRLRSYRSIPACAGEPPGSRSPGE